MVLIPRDKGVDGHLGRAREHVQGQAETETMQRERERVLMVSGGQKECLLLLLPVQPGTWSPFLQTEPEQKRKSGWIPISHTLSHVRCQPQASFLQDALLPKSQPPHQLRGLLAWFWKLPGPQGRTKQLGQGVQPPCQHVNPLLQGLV